jgi:hypothetical protein
VSLTVADWLLLFTWRSTDVAPAGNAVGGMDWSVVVDSVCVAMEVVPSDRSSW